MTVTNDTLTRCCNILQANRIIIIHSRITSSHSRTRVLAGVFHVTAPKQSTGVLSLVFSITLLPIDHFSFSFVIHQEKSLIIITICFKQTALESYCTCYMYLPLALLVNFINLGVALLDAKIHTYYPGSVIHEC